MKYRRLGYSKKVNKNAGRKMKEKGFLGLKNRKRVSMSGSKVYGLMSNIKFCSKGLRRKEK